MFRFRSSSHCWSRLSKVKRTGPERKSRIKLTMTTERIIITGFMGSGKSTVARTLAQLLGHEMIDLDEGDHARGALFAREIIETDGETGFREIETRVLARVLESNAAKVISLGGGTWTLVRNRDLIQSQGAFSVWLDAPFELCWSRIQESGGHRPLAPTKAATRILYNARRTHYELADLTIRTDENKSADMIAREISAAIVC